MTSFAIFRYKYGQIDAFVDSFNANTDKTIVGIIVIFPCNNCNIKIPILPIPYVATQK